MNRLNRIFHNKQIKLFWFLRSFARYLTPKRLLQSRLDRVLAEAERRPDWEYICRRADYYNKLSPAPATPPREGLRPLGDHKFRRGVKTAYFFDTYEFTRWFSDRLLWNTVPGDVTTVPDVPSIVKSRPICGDNANSVLLNLDKVRHFIFLRDDIRFREKSAQGDFPAGDHAASPPRTFHAHVFQVRSAAMPASRRPVPNIPRSGPNPIFRCTTT